MVPRQTFSQALSAVPAGWSLSVIFPWLCLVLVASTSAYGVQLAAAPIAPSTDHYVTQQHASALQATFRTPTVIVLIAGYDAATGDQMQVGCATTSDRVASDALLVKLKDFGTVASQVCTEATAP